MDDSAPRPTDFVAPSLDELAPLFPAYEIEAFIAAGGMGAVYKARQKSLDRPVAIKILPREFGDDEQFRSSFEAEAKAMARVNHPNLISVYDFGDIGGMLYIVMEFVQGKALYYSARKKIIDPDVAIPLVSTISRGLAHAHKAGIIHRDIKPANILLDTDATPKIGDFGLARPADLDDSDGVVYGTPGYTAPEVYHRQPVDQRSDIFSVGALLYELLVGKHPTPNSTSMTTGLDPRIDAIIVKATHANPQQRYHDVSQFADDLDALLPKLSAPTQTPVNSQAPLASQKKSSALPILVVLALLLGGAAAFLAFNKEKPTPPVVEQPKEKPKVRKPQKEKSQKNNSDRPDRPVPKLRPKKESMADTPSAPPTPQEEPKPSPDPEPEPEPTPEPEAQIAKTLPALKALRSELIAGKRDQFPPSSVEHNGSRFCLIRQKSTWHAASSFANKFGAQLAVLQTPDDLAWAKETFQTKNALWLGASDAGMEGKWHWIDGQPIETNLWKRSQPDNSPSDFDGENYAALASDSHNLEDLPQDRELPFLIEWKLDGTSPGSLEQQLARTAAALAAQKAPIFPTGTRNIGGSRFLYIDKKLSWSQAKAFAEKSGGHLAVASNEAEALHLKELLTPILAQDFEGCWLGGQRTAPGASTWTTVTGERFAFIDWLPNQPDNTGGKEDYLQYNSHNEKLGHNDGPDSEEWPASFLIEWSHPSHRNMPEDDEIATSGNPLIDQLQFIRNDIFKKHGRDYDRYHQKKQKIIEDFVEDATEELKEGLETPAAALAQRGIDYLKRMQEATNFPEKLPPGFNKRITKKFEDAKEKKEENQEDYLPAYVDAQKDYEANLEDAISSATKDNNLEVVDFFSKELKATQENYHHIRSILRNEALETPGQTGDTHDYVGHWESEGEGDKKVKFNLHADGSVILQSHDGGEGTWKIQEGKKHAIININGYEIQVKPTKKGLRARDQEGNRYILERVD